MGQSALHLAAQMFTVTDVKRVTEAATLAVREQAVEANGTSGNYQITLPPVADANGRIYAVYLHTAGGNTVTVASGEAAPQITAALTADDDFVLAFAFGGRWYLLETTIGGTRS